MTPTSNKKFKVLFLCTGNSVRSQMAEGAVNHLYGDRIQAYSAGLEPLGVNGYAIQVMAEKGIDISRHTSKAVEDVLDIDFDLVVSVCDHAAKFCPEFPRHVPRIHVSIPDPSFIEGYDDKVTGAFRSVRDKIFDSVVPRVVEEMEKKG
ncbi:MAG: arsenate reductase ArsC [bacterium]